MRLGDDPIADPFVQSTGGRRVQQRTGIRIAQAPDHHHRKAPQFLVLAPFPHGENHDHRFCQEPPRHKSKDLRRSPIEPLRVIHHADQGPLRGYLRQ